MIFVIITFWCKYSAINVCIFLLQNLALWDMGLVNFGICAARLYISTYWPASLHRQGITIHGTLTLGYGFQLPESCKYGKKYKKYQYCNGNKMSCISWGHICNQDIAQSWYTTCHMMWYQEVHTAQGFIPDMVLRLWSVGDMVMWLWNMHKSLRDVYTWLWSKMRYVIYESHLTDHLIMCYEAYKRDVCIWL